MVYLAMIGDSRIPEREDRTKAGRVSVRGALSLLVVAALGGGCLVIYDYSDYQSPPECAAEPNPPACKSCRSVNCASAVTACQNQSINQCPKWLACVDSCTAENAAWCFSDCGYENDPVRNILKNCMCEQCAAECNCFECP